MKAVDFIYDGTRLSDLGYMICRFDSSSGTETVSAGSVIAFDTVAMHGGVRHALAHAKYEGPFTTTFSICKKADSAADGYISVQEYASLAKWLNRRDFHQFTLIDKYEPEQDSIHFDGSFNIERVEFGGALIGLELTFESNRPFGYGDQVVVSNTVAAGGSFDVVVDSDDVGLLPVDRLVVTLQEDGDLTLANSLDTDPVYIAGCTAGEVLTLDCVHQIAESSLDAHAIYDDFNFHFFNLVSTADASEANTVTASLACTVEIRYTPVRKVVF